MLRLQLPRDLLAGIVSRHPLPLERQRAIADPRDQASLLGHHRPVARFAVIGQHMRHMERLHLIQHGQPGGRGAAIAKNIRHGLVLHHVTGNQGAIRFHQRQLIPLGMGSAEPQQACRHPAAEVDGGLVIKRHIRRTQDSARQQLLVFRRSAAEHVDHFLPMLFHLLLLHRIADEDGPGRETRLAGCVLGVEVGGGKKQLGVVGRQLGRHPRDGRSISRPHAGIHNQRGPAADHDRNVGKTHQRPHMIGDLRRVLLQNGVVRLRESIAGGQRGHRDKCHQCSHIVLMAKHDHYIPILLPGRQAYNALLACSPAGTAQRTMKRIALTLLLAASTPFLHADNCAAIKGLKLPETTITLAERVSSGDVDGPGVEQPIHDLPAFCRVVGIFHPSEDSVIRFEVWLPEKDWNHRFLGVGNGGFAGTIDYRSLSGNLHRGFATAGSDAGHQGQAEDAGWAYGHPEKIKDFGWRAVHLTAERSKEIVKAYYGKPIDKAYFDSCSDGGREALMEAQRFPEDYDGILAGAPANAWTHLLSAGVDVTQATQGDPRAYISSLKLPAIEKASLAACDAQDGVKDGIISEPSQCHFDPEVLLCKQADSLECLTQPQIDSLRKFYAGGKDSAGKQIFPGYVMGDENGAWRDWVLGQGPGAGSSSAYAANYFRYMVTGDTKWNILTANVDDSLAQAVNKTAADLDATNPDLSPFAARGGKLILYHGWNDPAISPWGTIAYYRSVQQTMGAQKVAGFAQLYMAPGVEHCVGGPGPSAFGQLGIPTTGGPKYGAFDALVDWVEKGTPAGTVIATKYNADNKAIMTRPLCPYPELAKYKGTGDTNDAANFVCGKD